MGFLTARSYLLAITVGVLLGISGFTFYYAKGLSYLSTDPKACVNCHVMQEQFDSWQKSSHHKVAVCSDCHMPHSFISKYLTKAENGFLHSKAFTLQNFKNPIQIRERSLAIVNDACLECHRDLAGHIAANVEDRASSDSLINRFIGNTGKERTCTRCHSSVGHLG